VERGALREWQVGKSFPLGQTPYEDVKRARDARTVVKLDYANGTGGGGKGKTERRGDICLRLRSRSRASYWGVLFSKLLFGIAMDPPVARFPHPLPTNKNFMEIRDSFWASCNSIRIA
jgi:hypothetical protein